MFGCCWQNVRFAVGRAQCPVCCCSFRPYCSVCVGANFASFGGRCYDTRVYLLLALLNGALTSSSCAWELVCYFEV